MIGPRPPRGRPRGAQDPRDRGSLPLTLLVIGVCMAMSAALTPLVIDQITTSRRLIWRADALQAAQAGLDVALGHLRAAVDADGEGALEDLPPCVLTGTADTVARYRVTITYTGYSAGVDPAGLEPQSCPPTKVPVTALLTAVGGSANAASLEPGSAGTRAIDATYTFRTNNENIPGGAIRLAEPTINPLCMDAGPDASPDAGTTVKMQLCKAGGSSGQRFAYTPDLNLKLVGSETGTAAAGMCLDAPLPRAAGDLVTLQPCLQRVPRQQWSLDDGSNFRGTTADGVQLDSLCLNLSPPRTAGGIIVLGACGGGGYNERIFGLAANVGAGMASAATGQLVNYEQFGRCLDVPYHDPTQPYMILWYCKQAPDGNVSWNQEWALPPITTSAGNAVAERIRTAGTDNPGYCLRSPGSPAADRYVTMSSCAADGELADPALKWTVYGDTGDYTTSYRIEDSYGYCLTPTDLAVPMPDIHGPGTAKAKVAVCTGSELQKWNAPANLNEPLAVTNVRER